MRRFKSGGAVRSAVRACSMLLMTSALLADSASARQPWGGGGNQLDPYNAVR